MPNKFIKFLMAASIIVAIFPASSSAQINLPSVNVPYALSNELGVGIIPDYPKPNEMVFINLSLYTDDLNSASISWYKDGKLALTGKGETKYSFRAGPAGQEAKIEIRVKLLSGTSFSKSFSLNPAGVDLVWEANSYVPPFYEGRALHPRQGSLKVVAVPEFIKNGRRISPQNLIYQWSNGIDVYQDQSGYGKNVVMVDGSLLGRQEDIEVLVTDPADNLAAQGSVYITPVDPEIVFYEIDPYYGHMFDTALANSFDLKTDEVQILAAPFYFTRESGGALRYQWTLNGEALPDLAGSMTAIFRKPKDQTGQSSISLQIIDANRILQEASNNLTMNFSK